MTSYSEHYKAKFGEGITLHAWTEEVQGQREGNFYITGLAGTAVAAWFRKVLRTKDLEDIVSFPSGTACADGSGDDWL